MIATMMGPRGAAALFKRPYPISAAALRYGKKRRTYPVPKARTTTAKLTIIPIPRYPERKSLWALLRFRAIPTASRLKRKKGKSNSSGVVPHISPPLGADIKKNISACQGNRRNIGSRESNFQKTCPDFQLDKGATGAVTCRSDDFLLRSPLFI